MIILSGIISIFFFTLNPVQDIAQALYFAVGRDRKSICERGKQNCEVAVRKMTSYKTVKIFDK